MGPRLAIIDWGIGGVSIYKLAKEKLGDVPILYFSDTGVTPYGKMTRGELVSRLNQVIGFLSARGIEQLVIGCNAASTAIDRVDRRGLKIEGMIESGIAAALRSKPTRLGLIGGRRTVLSGVYRRGFAENGVEVNQRIAQPLSALIESGDTSSDSLRGEARKILGPIKNSSHILLACTHYPAISHVLKDLVSPDTVLIDPSHELVKRLGKVKRAAADDIFVTSGDPGKMKLAARNAFGVRLGKISRITI